MIYLDHAAATPVSAKALAAMTPYFSEQFFNPSSPYLAAKRVREAYESAKSEIARTIGAKSVDLVITSGSTESINLAFTVMDGLAGKSLVPTTEHAAVLEAAKLRNHDLIGVLSSGLINLADLKRKIDDHVVLISVGLVNNELGTIQPIAEISELIRRVREDRLSRGITTPIYLHSDASQALSLLDVNVARLGVDLLTISSAKLGGPKGVGALYVARGVKLRPITVGGGQERGLRSGTENVPGVIGFAAALTDAHAHLASNRKKYQEMSTLFLKELEKSLVQAPLKSGSIVSSLDYKLGQAPLSVSREDTILPEVTVLGHPKHRLASFLPLSFPGIDAERLIYHLEQQEIYLSTGAACAANKGTKSHVLAAIGLSDAEIMGSLRISLGSTNTKEQMRVAARALALAVKKESARSHPSARSSADPSSTDLSARSSTGSSPAHSSEELT